MPSNDMPIHTTLGQPISVVPGRISWGAIIAGVFIALGAWILLYALGLALGLTTVDVQDTSSMRTTGIVTGIWSLIAPLIALFIGAAVTGRCAGLVDRVGGAIHGAVLWAVTMVAGAFLVTLVLGWMVGGLASTAGKAVQQNASTVGQILQGSQAGSSGNALSSLGLDPNDLLGPANDRLRGQNMPAVSGQQLEDALQGSLQRSLSQGHFDRQGLIVAITTSTPLNEQEAGALADRVAGHFPANAAPSGSSPSGAQAPITAKAAKAVKGTSQALWGMVGVLVLGCVAAIAGASLGVTRRALLASRSATPAHS